MSQEDHAELEQWWKRSQSDLRDPHPTRMLTELKDFMFRIEPGTLDWTLLIDVVLKKTLDTLLEREYSKPNTMMFVAEFLSHAVKLCTENVTHIGCLKLLYKAMDFSKRTFLYNQFVDTRFDFRDLDLPEIHEKLSPHWQVSRFYYSTVTAFLENKGDVALIDRIKNEPRVSVEYISEALAVLSQIDEMFEDYLEVAEPLHNTVISCILSYSDEEMKQVEKKSLTTLVGRLKRSFMITYKDRPELEDAMQSMETFTLDLGLKLLKLPYIQRRIEGLNEITTLCKAATKPTMQSNKDRCWIDGRGVCNWMLEHEIVEYLFGEQTHPEILKRSDSILNLLATNDCLTTGHLDLIWNFVTSEGKHESIVHQCWTILDSAAGSLQITSLDYLFDKITSLPLSYYESYELIGLIRRVTVSAMEQISRHGDDTSGNIYGLDLFWRGIQDGSGFSWMSSSSMLNSLTELWQHPFCDTQKVNFASRCVENLKNSISVPQSLTVLRSIIATYGRSHFDKSSDEVILWLDSHMNLLELFFSSLRSYTQAVRENTSPASHYPYPNSIHSRLEFLEFVCRYSSLDLKGKHIDILWENVILSPASPEIADTGYLFLRNALRSMNGRYILSERIIRYIFEQKVPTLPLGTLRPEGFNFFEFYFRMVNWNERKFEQIASEYRVMSFDLVGIDILWRIAFESQDPQVGDSAMVALLSLQKSLAPQLNAKVGEHREDFLRRCMQVLSDSGSAIAGAPLEDQQFHNLRISRGLTLIQKLIGLFESGADKHGTSVGHPITIIAKTLTSETMEIEMMDTDLIGDLRKKIGEKLHLDDASMLRLIAGGKDMADDKVSLKTQNLGNKSIVHIVKRQEKPLAAIGPAPRPSESAPTPSHMGDPHILPSQILAEKYFDQLFDLLTLPPPLCTDVWSLLMKLPTNAQMEHRLKEISSETNWPAVLDTGNVFKLYYCLQIIDALLQNNSSEEERQKYRERFVESGGLKHMLHILMKTDFLGTSASIDQQGGTKKLVCLALVLRIIVFLVTDSDETLDKDTLVANGIDVLPILNKLIELLTGLSQIPEIEVEDPTRQQPSDLDRVSELAVRFLASLVLSDRSWADLFIELVGSEQNARWLRLVLLETPSSALRHRITWLITRVSTADGEMISDNSRLWMTYLIRHFSAISDPQSVCELSKKSLPYFRALVALIEIRAQKSLALDDELQHLVKSIFRALTSHPNIEQSSASPPDETIVGLLETIQSLIRSYPQIRSEFGKQLLDEVFHRSLFDIPTVKEEGKIPPPRCKTMLSRTSALRLLLDLASGNAELMNSLCLKTLDLYETQTFSSNWDYAPSATEKSTCNFTGLRNLGATCYVNSLVQQFHMNPQFRERLFSVEDKSEDKKHSMLYQLQSIFSHLQESVMKYYDPTPFCSVYKSYGDEVMDPKVQMDVDEFFANLMDKIETWLKGTSQEKVLTEFFGGEVVNQIIPTECSHVVERTEPFLNLSLEVKNKFQLDQCLDLFIQGDMLEGDNKFHCSTCNSKVTALKRCCINKLPHFLVIHLKRFDFDLELLRRSKLNQYCAFPTQLNLEPYTKEGLARREQRNEIEALPEHPESFYEYSLTGVLVHQGTTDSGHYYSFIKDRDTQEWYKFNDSNVTPFNLAHLAEECYGGTYPQESFDPATRKWVTRNLTRSNNAYMLFYERTHPEKEIPPVNQEQLRQSVPQVLYDQIWRENVTFLRDKCLFEPGFTDFSIRILDQIDIKSFSEPHGPEIQETNPTDVATLHIMKLAFTFFIKTYSHSKQKDHLPQFVTKLCEVMHVFSPASRWFLQTLMENKEEWTRKFFTKCYDTKVLGEFIRLIVAAVSSLVKWESNDYDEVELLPAVPSTVEPSEKPKPPPKPGKKETGHNGKDVTHILPADSKPKSVSIQAIEFLLRSSASILQKPHRASSYWKAFDDITSVSPELNRALARRGHLRALLHLYLFEDSPYFSGDKAGAKSKAQLAYISDMGPLLSAIEHLVCSFSFPRTVDNPKRSPHAPIADEALPQEESALLLIPKHLIRYIGDQVNMESVARLCCHLGWENFETSKEIINAACFGINRDNNDKFPPYAAFLGKFLPMEDSYEQDRMEIGLERLIRVLIDNLKYPLVSTSTTNFITEMTKRSVHARRYLLSHFELWAWRLLLTHIRKVRQAGEELVESLVAEFLSSEDIGEYGYEALSTVLSNILEMLRMDEIPKMLSVTKPKHPDFAPSPEDHKLAPILRLLGHILSKPEMVETFAQEHMVELEPLWTLFKQIDCAQIPCDEHKHLMHVCWDHLFDNKQVMDNLLQIESVAFQFTFVSLRGASAFYAYNNRTTPVLYSAMWKLCMHSEEYRTSFMNNSNFEWCLKNLYFESAEYPKAEEVTHSLFLMIPEYDNHRNAWIKNLLGCQNGFSVNPLRVLNAFRELLRTRKDCFTFLRNEGLEFLMRRYCKLNTFLPEQEVEPLIHLLRTVTSWDSITPEEEGNVKSPAYLVELFVRAVSSMSHYKQHSLVEIALEIPPRMFHLSEIHAIYIKFLNEWGSRFPPTAWTYLYYLTSPYLLELSPEKYPSASGLALWGAIAAQGEADYDMFLVHLPVLTAVKPEHLDEIAQIVTRVAELGWFLKEDESLTRFLEAYLPLLTDALDVGDFLNGHFKQFFETLPGPDEDSIKQFLYAFKLYKVQLSEENEASLSNFKGKQ